MNIASLCKRSVVSIDASASLREAATLMREEHVGALASRKLAAVRGSASISEAVTVMKDAGVRRLFVIDDENRLSGFVSADDIVEALANDFAGLAHALRAGIAREATVREPVAPPRPRPVFLPHGTPGTQ